MLQRNPTPKILAAIQEKYELLDIINVIDIDHNFSMLEERLLNIKKESPLVIYRFKIVDLRSDI